MRKVLATTVAIACLGVFVIPGMTQTRVRNETQLIAPNVSGPVRDPVTGLNHLPGVNPNPYQVATIRLNGGKDQKRDQEIATATKQLRDADNSTQRTEARDRLVELLSEDYDARLEIHAEELNRLEDKLAQMRARLKKRRAAKQDMIELRLKVLEAEASDLGWPARNAGGRASWNNVYSARTTSSSFRPSGTPDPAQPFSVGTTSEAEE